MFGILLCMDDEQLMTLGLAALRVLRRLTDEQHEKRSDEGNGDHDKRNRDEGRSYRYLLDGLDHGCPRCLDD